jgi:hypothetical protein
MENTFNRTGEERKQESRGKKKMRKRGRCSKITISRGGEVLNVYWRNGVGSW